MFFLFDRDIWHKYYEVDGPCCGQVLVCVCVRSEKIVYPLLAQTSVFDVPQKYSCYSHVL